MIKRYLFFFLITLASLPGKSQTNDDFPVITKNDLPEATFSTPRTFAGSSLFGYMNGGAELYLEYGCESASITEISLPEGKYKTEIFRMTDPEAAFGIFSVSKYRCLAFPDLAKFTCQNRYQLQICKGPYYISIINKTGSRTDSLSMLRLGKVISDKIGEAETDLSGYLPGIPHSLLRADSFLAKGKLGIINGAPDLEDFFAGLSGYTAVILKGSPEMLISVRFDGNESIKAFTDLHKWDQGRLSEQGPVIIGGEKIRLIGNNHLLIEIVK